MTEHAAHRVVTQSPESAGRTGTDRRSEEERMASWPTPGRSTIDAAVGIR